MSMYVPLTIFPHCDHNGTKEHYSHTLLHFHGWKFTYNGVIVYRTFQTEWLLIVSDRVGILELNLCKAREQGE